MADVASARPMKVFGKVHTYLRGRRASPGFQVPPARGRGKGIYRFDEVGQKSLQHRHFLRFAE